MLFTMSGDGSLGYWSHKTIHYSSHHHNNENEINEEEGLEVSLGEERHGHRYLEISHYSLSNHGGRRHRYFETNHTFCGGYVGTGGSS